ncbi:MAG: DUF2062 domain-containing protein [Thiotrichales bacterium]|nr:DUF2062 domain-containing protein [Thiotrichales bacterium]
MNRFVKLRFKKLGRAVKGSAFLNKFFPNFKSPVYWKGDAYSWAKGGFIGCFFMMLPIPFQMLFSSITAYFFKANIPLATALAWVTNPFTMVPIWFIGYRFGAHVLGTPALNDITSDYLKVA